MAEMYAVGMQFDTPVLAMVLRAASVPSHLMHEVHVIALHG